MNCIFSRNNFLFLDSKLYMVKIRNKRKLKWCLKQYHRKEIKQKWLSKYLGITTRRFRQIYSEYKESTEIPVIGRNMGRPRKQVPAEWLEIIKKEWNEDRLNALYLEKVIYHRHKIRIPHNAIHRIMLGEGLIGMKARLSRENRFALFWMMRQERFFQEVSWIMQ